MKKMKIILTLIITTILIISSMTAVATTKNKKEKKIAEKISFSKPIISEKNEHTIISLEETDSFIMKTGYPMLPVFTKTFTFPFGTKIKSVTCEPRGIKQTIISKDIQPAPAPMIIGSIKAKRNTVVKKKADVYNSVNPYPNQWYDSRVGTGLDGNDRVVFLSVEIYPMRCIPAKNLIEYASSFEIIVNREEPVQPITFDEEYNFVILTPYEFSDELGYLVSHKISMGISTKLVTLNEIHGSIYFPVQGRDDPEKIKYFIKNAYDNWRTTDVMIVGGIDDFPARETHIRIENDQGADDEEIFVSDLYYADIYQEGNVFCSWDSNDNDVFAEYNWGADENYDEMDMFPDVRIGRLAATSSTEVNTVVDKIITYETGKAYTQNWFNNIVVIGGDTAPDENSDPDEEDIDEGEYLNQAVLDVMDGFIPDIIWDSNNRLSSIVPSGVTNINNGINEGCGFVDWSGHGSPTVWTTYPHNVHRQILPTPYPPGNYYNTYNGDLTNGDKLPIVMCGGCSLGKYPVNNNCFAWAYLSNPNGGGIASFGASALGYVYLGKWVTYGLVEGFMLNLYEAFDDGAITLGEMWSRAVNNYISGNLESYDYKTLTELHTFGDPTLAIAEDSQPPVKPDAPEGHTSGGINVEHTYTASTTDPDGDDISYMFDWGDGEFSEWIGPLSSGDTAEAKHSWDKQGSYEIRVIAKDDHGVQSEWSDSLPISMAKNNALLKILFLTIFGVTLVTVLAVLILLLLQ